MLNFLLFYLIDNGKKKKTIEDSTKKKDQDRVKVIKISGTFVEGSNLQK